MIYELYSVKDVLSGALSKIEIMQNEDIAKRWFINLCKESKIAHDLQLFKLGTYNIELGSIDSKVEFVMSGAEVLHEKV